MTDAGDGEGGGNRNKSFNNLFFPYLFPPKGTLTDAGDVDGERKNIKKHPPSVFSFVLPHGSFGVPSQGWGGGTILGILYIYIYISSITSI